MKALDLESEARSFFIEYYDGTSGQTNRIGVLTSQSAVNECVKVICQATRHLGLKSIYDITKPFPTSL